MSTGTCGTLCSLASGLAIPRSNSQPAQDGPVRNHPVTLSEPG
jgi:hypothetical protein